MKVYIYTHRGWYLFCPVALNPLDGELCPLPPRGLGWLFALAHAAQQGLNALLCLCGHPDAAGFVFHHVRPLRQSICREMPPCR